jgi:signal transduction histidine kinase
LSQVVVNALHIQTAADVSRAVIGVLDLSTLLQQVVELVQKRFDLYYVGLFLVSSETSSAWAVLRMASGEAARQMLAQGHRLKVAGESMIGQCIADHRPRIALDVGEEAIRFDNPLLPETHSEMALPLVTREGAIGALSVQSRERGAFGETEMAVFETLAGQLANAIASARLYDQALQEILQRIQTEDELRQRTLELEARNAELDAFAHTVAHDLKSPMAGLIGLSTMLESCIDEFSSATVDDLLHRITQAGFKITNIINALLLLSSLRREEVQGEALDMADIVSEAQKRLADLVAERQTEISAPDEWPAAVGYAPWVEEVWVNYISNALKYGGEADEEVSPRIELGFDEMTDLHVRFWVRDNGPGLTPEAQASLFTPFTRLHQVRAEGHGLGLSIVQRIVEKLGGEVGVESQVSQGSVFYFTLPTTA